MNCLYMCYIHQSESTSIFGTNDVICCAIWCHQSLLPYQFSIVDDGGGWQTCNGDFFILVKNLFGYKINAFNDVDGDGSNGVNKGMLMVLCWYLQ